MLQLVRCWDSNPHLPASPAPTVDTQLIQADTVSHRQRSGSGGVADLLDRNLNLYGPGAKP